MKIRGNVGDMVKISGKVIRIISDTEGTRYEIRTIERNSSSHIITLDEEFVDFMEEEAEPAPVDLESIVQKIGEGARIKRELTHRTECSDCMWSDVVKPDEYPCKDCTGQYFKSRGPKLEPEETPEKETAPRVIRSSYCLNCKYLNINGIGLDDPTHPCFGCISGTKYTEKPKRGRPRKATVEDLTAKAEKIRKESGDNGKN